ncbi:MAG: hypothetical protein ABSG52_11740 [Terriglobales bacterium]|jgi:hypothetical protein
MLLTLAAQAFGQGGPPMRTDDPGTPGNGNWEINIAVTTEMRAAERTFETPLLDINYGVGERIQLKFEIPFVVQAADGARTQRGFGNSLAGVKWRFFEKGGWALSTYPQLEFNNPTESVEKGLAESGTRMLLPLEFTRKCGPVYLNLEIGYSFAPHGEREWILGLAAGREINRKLEIMAEIYDTGEVHEGNETTFGVGGRYKLGGPFTLLLMAGRSFHGLDSAQPRFIGYGGLQINLERHHSHNSD